MENGRQPIGKTNAKKFADVLNIDPCPFAVCVEQSKKLFSRDPNMTQKEIWHSLSIWYYTPHARYAQRGKNDDHDADFIL